MKTIREAKVGKATVRLVQTPKGYSGIVLLDGKRKALEDGDDADDVWRRISGRMLFGFSRSYLANRSMIVSRVPFAIGSLVVVGGITMGSAGLPL